MSLTIPDVEGAASTCPCGATPTLEFCGPSLDEATHYRLACLSCGRGTRALRLWQREPSHVLAVWEAFASGAPTREGGYR